MADTADTTPIAREHGADQLAGLSRLRDGDAPIIVALVDDADVECDTVDDPKRGRTYAGVRALIELAQVDEKGNVDPDDAVVLDLRLTIEQARAFSDQLLRCAIYATKAREKKPEPEGGAPDGQSSERPSRA